MTVKIADHTVAIGIDEPCPATDIAILEDDTCGVLAAPSDLRSYDEHPMRLFSELHRFKPYPVGQLRRQDNTLHAMVVELGQDPICTADSIGIAALLLARHPLVHTAASIRLQMLGCIHAALDPQTSYSALKPLFQLLHQSGPRHLYIQVLSKHKATVSKLFQSRGRLY